MIEEITLKRLMSKVLEIEDGPGKLRKINLMNLLRDIGNPMVGDKIFESIESKQQAVGFVGMLFRISDQYGLSLTKEMRKLASDIFEWATEYSSKDIIEEMEIRLHVLNSRGEDQEKVAIEELRKIASQEKLVAPARSANFEILDLSQFGPAKDKILSIQIFNASERKVFSVTPGDDVNVKLNTPIVNVFDVLPKVGALVLS